MVCDAEKLIAFIEQNRFPFQTFTSIQMTARIQHVWRQVRFRLHPHSYRFQFRLLLFSQNFIPWRMSDHFIYCHISLTPQNHWVPKIMEFPWPTVSSELNNSVWRIHWWQQGEKLFIDQFSDAAYEFCQKWAQMYNVSLGARAYDGRLFNH